MTKRLSPERIAEIRESWNGRGHVGWEPALLDHVDAIEEELREPTRDEMLAADWAWVNAKLQTAEKELAEAKAEIARLKGVIDRSHA